MPRATCRRCRLGVVSLPLIAAMLDIWFLTLVISVASSNPVVTDPVLGDILDAVLEDTVSLIESNRPLTGFGLPCTLYVHFPSGRTRRDILQGRSTEMVLLRCFPPTRSTLDEASIEFVGEFHSEALRLDRVVRISPSEIGVWYQSRSPFHGVKKGVLRLVVRDNRWSVVERRTGESLPWRQFLPDRPILEGNET